jgi:hypothetical protein
MLYVTFVALQLLLTGPDIDPGVEGMLLTVIDLAALLPQIFCETTETVPVDNTDGKVICTF